MDGQKVLGLLDKFGDENYKPTESEQMVIESLIESFLPYIDKMSKPLSKGIESIFGEDERVAIIRRVNGKVIAIVAEKKGIKSMELEPDSFMTVDLTGFGSKALKGDLGGIIDEVKSLSDNYRKKQKLIE